MSGMPKNRSFLAKCQGAGPGRLGSMHCLRFGHRHGTYTFGPGTVTAVSGAFLCRAFSPLSSAAQAVL